MVRLIIEYIFVINQFRGINVNTIYSGNYFNNHGYIVIYFYGGRTNFGRCEAAAAGTPTRLQAPGGKLPALSNVSSLQRSSTAIAVNNGAVQRTNTFSTGRSALARRILMHALNFV